MRAARINRRLRLPSGMAPTVALVTVLAFLFGLQIFH